MWSTSIIFKIKLIYSIDISFRGKSCFKIILSSDSDDILNEDQPDYILLLAWHLSGPIINKWKKRGLKSKFIVPLPKVEIIWTHFPRGKWNGAKKMKRGEMGRRPGLRAGPGPAQRPPQWSLPKWPQMLIIPRVFLLFGPFRGPQPAPSCPPDPDAQPSNCEIHFSPAGQRRTEIEPKWL